MRAAPRSGVVHAHGRQARWRSVGSRPPLYCHHHSHHAGEASRRDLAATADTRYARICQRRDERRHRVGLLADERGDGDVALDDVRRRRVRVDDARPLHRPCSAYHEGTVNKLHVGLSVLAFAHTILCRYTFCIHINALRTGTSSLKRCKILRQVCLCPYVRVSFRSVSPKPRNQTSLISCV